MYLSYIPVRIYLTIYTSAMDTFWARTLLWRSFCKILAFTISPWWMAALFSKYLQLRQWWKNNFMTIPHISNFHRAVPERKAKVRLQAQLQLYLMTKLPFPNTCTCKFKELQKHAFFNIFGDWGGNGQKYLTMWWIVYCLMIHSAWFMNVIF